jgi:hypothetical protein
MRGKFLAQRIAFRHCLIATPTVIFNKDRYNLTNSLFSVGLSLGEDLVAWIRLAGPHPKKFGHLGKALTVVNVNNSSQKYKTFDEVTTAFVKEKLRLSIFISSLY